MRIGYPAAFAPSSISSAYGLDGLNPPGSPYVVRAMATSPKPAARIAAQSSGAPLRLRSCIDTSMNLIIAVSLLISGGSGRGAGAGYYHARECGLITLRVLRT